MPSSSFLLLQPVLAVALVRLALLGIAEDLVGAGDLEKLEFGFFRVVLVGVWGREGRGELAARVGKELRRAHGTACSVSGGEKGWEGQRVVSREENLRRTHPICEQEARWASEEGRVHWERKRTALLDLLVARGTRNGEHLEVVRSGQREDAERQ
jgi:hypothetical protein